MPECIEDCDLLSMHCLSLCPFQVGGSLPKKACPRMYLGYLLCHSGTTEKALLIRPRRTLRRLAITQPTRIPQCAIWRDCMRV